MGTKVKKCLIFSGAPEEDLSYCQKYLKEKPFVICADNGYKKCQSLGVKPDLIIGDFDSSDIPDMDCEILALQVRKDDTDTFYCVKEAIRRGYTDLVIVGGIGSRIDHTYSNILSVNYCFERGIDCVLVNRQNKISVISGVTEIDNFDYKIFSVFALFEKCRGLSIVGAQYALDNIDLAPSEQFTQSNAFTDTACKIILREGKLLLVQSND